MVTLHLLKLLEENGFGIIDIDLFFEKLTLDKKGLYIVSRGGNISRGSRNVQAFDIYSRGYNDVEGAIKLKEVLNFLQQSYGTVCKLPILSGISETIYDNVAIEVTSNIENVGLDANNKMNYVITGQVTYDIGE